MPIHHTSTPIWHTFPQKVYYRFVSAVLLDRSGTNSFSTVVCYNDRYFTSLLDNKKTSEQNVDDFHNCTDHLPVLLLYMRKDFYVSLGTDAPMHLPVPPNESTDPAEGDQLLCTPPQNPCAHHEDFGISQTKEALPPEFEREPPVVPNRRVLFSADFFGLLVNRYNTCFLNAVLQALACLYPFSSLKWLEDNSKNHEDCNLQLVKTLLFMRESLGTRLHPSALIDTLQNHFLPPESGYSIVTHMDACELLDGFFNECRLSDCVHYNKALDIHKYFTFKFKQCLICTSNSSTDICPSVDSENFDYILRLFVEMTQV